MTIKPASDIDPNQLEVGQVWPDSSANATCQPSSIKPFIYSFLSLSFTAFQRLLNASLCWRVQLLRPSWKPKIISSSNILRFRAPLNPTIPTCVSSSPPCPPAGEPCSRSSSSAIAGLLFSLASPSSSFVFGMMDFCSLFAFGFDL